MFDSTAITQRPDMIIIEFVVNDRRITGDIKDTNCSHLSMIFIKLTLTSKSCPSNKPFKKVLKSKELYKLS